MESKVRARCIRTSFADRALTATLCAASPRTDATTADNGTVALYSTFAVFGFFGGTICNKIGPRLTLSIGSLGYSLYIGSLYSTVISQTKARENFVIAAGAILGVCAGMLWTAQGAFMLSYSTESTKGRFTALFWMIFNLGAVIGAVIPLGQNWNSPDAKAASGSTYIAFMVRRRLSAERLRSLSGRLLLLFFLFLAC